MTSIVGHSLTYSLERSLGTLANSLGLDLNRTEVGRLVQARLDVS